MAELSPPLVRRLAEIAGLKVYLVSGEYIRNHIDIDFTAGGNSGVYPYVPVDEIWIDDALHGLDQTATTYHEIVERYHMIYHHMSYDKAHDMANSAEDGFRKELRRAGVKDFDARRVASAVTKYLGRA